jgi:glyoxylase-like metal-dependent hydrolase (beta-lactamase superfamily II)
MSKSFASSADLTDKQASFVRLSENAWAYTTDGDPNTGIVVGDDGVLVVDTQATPVMAQDVLRRIRSVTDKPVKYVVLSHYHAVRILGASAYGAQQIVASRATWEMICERGEADMQSEIGRFPRLFRAVESIPGLTWPTMVFDRELTLWMGKLEVRLVHVGRGHTQGDTIVWLPSQRVLFSGDLVEFNAGIYAGDAHLVEWPDTLERLRALGPEKLVPGRGPALTSPEECDEAIRFTQEFVRALYACARDGVAGGRPLKDVYREARARLDPRYLQFPIYEHCMPFDVSRAYDEARGIARPRIWTAERDREMWAELEG